MTFLKRKVAILLSIACSTIQLSMTWPPLADYYGILESEDYELEWELRQGRPALSSASGDSIQWKSFNQWLCLPQETIEFDCFDDDFVRWEEINSEDRDGKGYYPTMSVPHDGHHYTIQSPSRVAPKHCFKEIEQWRNLINDQRGFCIFAAKSPSENELLGRGGQENSSLWMLYGVKTAVGEIMAPIYRQSEDKDYVAF